MAAWLDGKPVRGSWLELRALHYGDGVFRTLLLYAGQLHARDAQLRKLGEDAQRLQLQPPEDLQAQLDRALAGQRQGTVKLLLSRDRAGRRGYAAASDQARLLIALDPPAPPNPRAWSRGVQLADSPVQLGRQPLLAGIKHLNRLEQVLASRGWAAGQDEALMCDDAGHAICGTRSNLFALRAGRLLTPVLNEAGVTGVTRAAVLACAQALGLPVEQRPIVRAELDCADELFLSNSLFGIWPVGQLGARPLTAPGPFTRHLARALQHPAIPATDGP